MVTILANGKPVCRPVLGSGHERAAHCPGSLAVPFGRGIGEMSSSGLVVGDPQRAFTDPDGLLGRLHGAEQFVKSAPRRWSPTPRVSLCFAERRISVGG